jgi:hypothetical protein
MHLLWSGEAGKRTLTVFGNQYQPLPMQRPPRIASTVPAAGNYRITLDTVRLRYEITPPALSRMRIRSSPYICFRPSTAITACSRRGAPAPRGQLPDRLHQPCPRPPFSFRLVKNGNLYEALSKDTANPFTRNNGLLDAELGTTGDQLVSFIPTSEFVYFYFNPVSRSYRVDMSASPQYADGYGDPAFYGPPILSNTNAPALQDIRTVSIRIWGGLVLRRGRDLHGDSRVAPQQWRGTVCAVDR